MTVEVLVDLVAGVGTITLNRPGRINALTAAMIDRLTEVFTDWRADDRVERVVLRGAGGHFCAGLDLTEVVTGTPEERLAAMQARNRRLGARYEEFSLLPQVVIAAVEGAAHAGGPLGAELRKQGEGGPVFRPHLDGLVCGGDHAAQEGVGRVRLVVGRIQGGSGLSQFPRRPSTIARR